MASTSGRPVQGPTAPGEKVQEFTIRVPKNLKKRHHVMRYNATLNVDFAQWSNVKMERENNLKEFRGMDEDTPKFGAGSEYNRELREEVRRKKYGIIAKKYKPEAQPWILKVGGKTGKKFRGIREGGVGENAAFYVFTHAPDGAIEAYPLHEWYNFQPIQRYKALSAEEAELEFGKRKKVLNYFSLMLRKRLKGDEDAAEDPDDSAIKNAKKGKALKISDMDEWIDSDDESDSNSDEETKKEDKDSDDEKKKKKKNAPEKKKKRDLDDEAVEESDDGDEEGRELDYISDSSEEELDPEGKIDKDMGSVAEENALRKLLTSDEDSDDEEKKSGDESDKDEEEKKKEAKEAKENKEAKDKKKKKTKKKSKEEKKDSSSGSSGDSSDSEIEVKKKKKDNSGNNSRSASPSVTQLESNKRKQNSMPSDLGLGVSENSNSPSNTPAKKPRLDAPSFPSFSGVVSGTSKDDYGITEEAVRRYLMRKPMTTTELLTKFKNKKTGVSSEKLVETMTQILKKINPVKQTIQGKMYLSIKVNK